MARARFSHRLVSTAASESALPLEQARQAQPPRRPGIAAIWNDALSTFASNALPILFLGLIGFAVPVCFGVTLSLLFNLDQFIHATGAFTTFQGLATLDSIGAAFVVLSIEAVIGLPLLVFAQGGITVLALQKHAAFSAVFARFPALLTGSLINSALIAFAVVALNAPMRELGMDLSNVGQKCVTLAGVVPVTALRTIDALVPDPGSPFKEFVPRLRHTTFNELEATQHYNQHLADEYGSAVTGISTLQQAPSQTDRTNRLWLVSLGSITAMLIADALLRFRVAAALCSATPNVLVPLWRSASMGLRHFGTITVHVWSVRFVLAAINMIFVIAPIVVLESLIAPSPLAQELGLSPLMLQPFWLLAGLAVVYSAFASFQTVYDARLYVALSPPAQA